MSFSLVVVFCKLYLSLEFTDPFHGLLGREIAQDRVVARTLGLKEQAVPGKLPGETQVGQLRLLQVLLLLGRARLKEVRSHLHLVVFADEL